MNRGGKRKGAGRKPAPEGTVKVPMTVKVKPGVREYLRQCENATATIESAIERSKGYREWRTKHGEKNGQAENTKAS